VAALLTLVLRCQRPAAAPRRVLALQVAFNLGQCQGLAASAARFARDESRAHDRAFNARLLPQVSLQGDVANYRHAFVGVLTENGTQFAPQTQNESFMGVTVAQPLPWFSGTLKLSSLLDRVDITGNAVSRTWTSTPFQIELDQD